MLQEITSYLIYYVFVVIQTVRVDSQTFLIPCYLTHHLTCIEAYW